MEGFFARVGWIIAASVVIAYATHLIIGGIVNKRAAAINNPVLVRDELSANVHRLSGMVFVPSPCDELFVKTVQRTADTFELNFRTWREPSVECRDDWTPRSFREIVFAPGAGVYFVGTLDEAPLAFGVISVIAGRE